MPRARENEESILRRILQRTGASPAGGSHRKVILGTGDDAALFQAKAGNETILTCDWFLEGTHFLRDKHPPDAIGWKCLARAVSDIAAMGGVPRCFLLSLALPSSHTGKWMDNFLGGLRRAARKFRCILAGGDTTRRKQILINVMAVGEVPAGSATLRSGARADDIIYVSGCLGEAELGLRLLKRSKGRARARNPWLRKHLYPEPRLALGQWMAKNHLATAMMDLSDGLSSDLPRLCSASGVGAQIVGLKIPMMQVPQADRNRGVDPLELALHGGDDYELLFTVPRHKAKFLAKSFQGVALTPIGRITRERGLRVLAADGREHELTPAGWDPFREPD